MIETDVVVIGAGPYGLAATAHLRRAGIDATNFGPPIAVEAVDSPESVAETYGGVLWTGGVSTVRVSSDVP